VATLADVAKQAAVSTGTASRVLNNKMTMPIPQSTIDRIRNAAQLLDYQPNAVARALATGKTRTIGLHYRGTTETMFIRILEAVEAKALERGYHLIVSSNLASFSTQNTIDGLIYIASLDDLPVQAPPCQKPTVYVLPSGKNDPIDSINRVTWSEFDAAFLAVQHLVTLGHRHIGALWGDYRNTESVPPRVAGFRAAIAQFDAVGTELFEEFHADLIQRGVLQMRQILESHPAVTAIFARNDYLALGALKALRQARIEVPEQISLIHYGDSVLSQAAYPELTSVSHPNAEASVIALEKLIEMSEGGRDSFPTISLPITLCERDSCALKPNFSR
jgi:LacI family transcriptional regulator